MLCYGLLIGRSGTDDMKRNASSRIALVVLAVAALGTLSPSRLLAQTRIISSDGQSRFLALGISKSLVVEVSRDIKNIVVADRTIATVVALSHRQIEIIGASLGQTNVFLLDKDGRQIEGFDVAVKGFSQQHQLANYPYPASIVEVVEGGKDGSFISFPLNCTPIKCIDARKPGAEQPPGTENVNIVSNAPTGVLLPGPK